MCEKLTWKPASIHLQDGDVITSKKGFLNAGITGKKYISYKLKIIQINEDKSVLFESLGRKEIADIKED